MALNARLRRISSDYEQIKADFAGHKYIKVQPEEAEIPEKYFITYFINGIHLLPNGSTEVIGRHEIEIVLHADYPRYKPLCKINTPIWHPNFRDGQICIGDIWGAGESLSDIIINIGDMIQYKSWNSFSPLSAEAAQWAIKNKNLFPIGTIDLHMADYAASGEDVDIEIFGDDLNEEDSPQKTPKFIEVNSAHNNKEEPVGLVDEPKPESLNDFDIMPDELAGIEYVPSAQRMQSISQASLVEGKKVNFKTIFFKGIIWGLIGGFLGFLLPEIMGLNSVDGLISWFGYESYERLYFAYDTGRISYDEALAILAAETYLGTAIWTAIVAAFIGASLGLGEGIYYGSKEKAIKYLAIGAGVAIVSGLISGALGQYFYGTLLAEDAAPLSAALVRGFAWAILGLGTGLATGLIKPDKKRVQYCVLGGVAGGFIGGVFFDLISNAITVSETDTGTASRAIGVIILGVLIGLGIGLLEQFAKTAWLKVIRGEFEGKEYLVFNGVTSIGNNGSNTIVLFKDKLVGTNHCDISLEGGKYTLIDKGSPMGTVVNGNKISKHVLKKGDTISIGNTSMVFNTK